MVGQKEFECLVNSEVFQTVLDVDVPVRAFECLVNSEVFQTVIGAGEFPQRV